MPKTRVPDGPDKPATAKLMKDHSLKGHNTFRVGGRASYLIVPKSVDDLIWAIRFARARRMRTFILGNGSNVLFSDKGFKGLVIKLAGGLNSIDIAGDRAIAGSGVHLSNLVNRLASKGLKGLQFTYGVPATVGGAVAMNFGAFGKWIGGAVVRVFVADEKVGERSVSGKSVRFGYRTSSLLKRGLVITKVEFKLRRGKPKEIKLSLKELLARRKAAQPLGIPNAGCVFKNPPSDHAGRLIEEAGMKGRRVGDAQVSTKHANFIVNLGSATSRDITALMKKVQAAVFKRSGVRLKPEIRVIRFSS